MSLLNQRCFRIHQTSSDPAVLKQQVDDLRHMLFSVIQDLEIMRNTLARHGLLAAPEHKDQRIKSMLADHSSAGATPWRAHSYYPHTLDTQAYLREILDLSDDEIKEYEAEAQHRATLT